MIFFKILDFKYNGKNYTAFRNKLGYQTYLEYTALDNGTRKYRYLDIDTYQKLFNMFGRKKASLYDDSMKGKKIKFTPKVLTRAGLCALTASLLIGPKIIAQADDYSETGRLWPYKLFDRNEVIITEDYEVYEVTKNVNLLTADGMELYWTDNTNITFDDVREELAKNENIDDELSNYISNFVDNLEITHPNINLTCFYHNVKILRSKATGTQGMLQACGSATASACFLAEDGTIYYNPQKLNEENFTYIMYHEIGHMLVNGSKEIKNYETERHYTTGTNSGFMIEEGLNTLLIEEVMGIKIDDVAYRLPANYVKILMETTGYTFEDYVNGNHLEFEERIAKRLEFGNYNVDNLPYLMEYQKYNVRQGKDVDIDDSEFYDLYAVIAAAYFQHNISSCTSQNEIIELYDSLIETITEEVHTREGEYYFDFSGIRDTLYEILEENGIRKNIWPDEKDLETELVICVYSNTRINQK